MTDVQPMLSRVADSLYWMSRYLERAEHSARLIDVHLNNLVEADDDPESSVAATLLDSLAIETDFDDFDDSSDLFEFLVFDHKLTASISATIGSARENARQVREQLSSEMWMQLNKLYLLVQSDEAQKIWQVSPHDYLVQIRDGSHLFQGVTDATMNRSQGWLFIQIGRYIERALSLLTMLDVHFSEIPLVENEISTEHYFDLVGSLKSVSGFEAYCKVYNPNVRTSRILEFLLFNEEFPRSLRFCIDNLQTSLQILADFTGRRRDSLLYKRAGRLQSNLRFDDLDDIEDLSRYLNGIKQQIYQIHDTLYDTYISYDIETAL